MAEADHTLLLGAPSRIKWLLLEKLTDLPVAVMIIKALLLGALDL